MKKNEYEELEKTAFQLEQNISLQTAKAIAKAQSFQDGYNQAISDMLKVAKGNVERE